MQHLIPIDQIGAKGEPMADPIAACVHCGFCLPACPTYKVMGEEQNSPRGRIVLMKNVLEGTLSAEDATPYIDKCLGCLGCVTVCPSGVKYGELLVAYRAHTEPQRTRTPMSRLTRLLVRETLPYPSRFRLAASLGKIGKAFAGALPTEFRNMLGMLPDALPPALSLPEVTPAIGPRRARVALLTGCVQQALAPQINLATLQVLAKNGVEVIIPRDQGCCGSLGMHTGDEPSARKLAAHNLRAFPRDVDAVLINAAGCGSGIKEYGLLFRGTPLHDEAGAYAAKSRDISEFLDDLGLIAPGPLPKPLDVAYHDACHLAHAQGIMGAPRRLLGAIPNIKLLEIPEGDICCGSAGTYNIEQPEIAKELGERKARNIQRVNPDVVATGNIGCLIQIRNGLAAAGRPTPVLHTVELLALAYGFGKSAG
jgi:glycolate oxidase iron-sulfur subunit